MTTLEILKKARALLAEGWCQGQSIAVKEGDVYKRDMVTALNDASAGAGMMAVGGPASRAAFALMWEATGGHGIIQFNDDPHTDHALVLWSFDCAIAELEARPIEPE
jgi:hypothetical protein